jgi:hypothetical protein
MTDFEGRHCIALRCSLHKQCKASKTYILLSSSTAIIMYMTLSSLLMIITWLAGHACKFMIRLSHNALISVNSKLDIYITAVHATVEKDRVTLSCALRLSRSVLSLLHQFMHKENVSWCVETVTLLQQCMCCFHQQSCQSLRNTSLFLQVVLALPARSLRPFISTYGVMLAHKVRVSGWIYHYWQPWLTYNDIQCMQVYIDI